MCSLHLCSSVLQPRAVEVGGWARGPPTGRSRLREECWSPSMSQGEARVGPVGCLGAQEAQDPSFSITAALCTFRGGLVTLGHPYAWKTGFPWEGESSRESMCAQEARVTLESGLGVLGCGIPISRACPACALEQLSQDRGSGYGRQPLPGSYIQTTPHPPSLHLKRLTGSLL